MVSLTASLSWVRKGKGVGDLNEYFKVTQRLKGPAGLGPQVSSVRVLSANHTVSRLHHCHGDVSVSFQGHP